MLFMRCVLLLITIPSESLQLISFLHISKAFDKVNHYGLYIKLMKRNVPPILVHVIINYSSLLYCTIKSVLYKTDCTVQ